MEKSYKVDAVLIDTGIIYALADRTDSWHTRAINFSTTFRGKLLVPSPVISEVCYLLNSFLGASAELAFLHSLINREIVIEHSKEDDLLRIVELLKKYRDQNIGYVDAALIAVAERLKITKVLTTDRKHFSIIKPKHCESFAIFP